MAVVYGKQQLQSAADEFTRCWAAKDPLSPDNVKLMFHALVLLCAGVGVALETLQEQSRR